MTTEARISVGGQGNAGVTLDSTVITQSTGQTAYREAVGVTDPDNTAARARVLFGAPSALDAGLVVKSAEGAAQLAMLQTILVELRVISALLQSGLNVPDQLETLRGDAGPYWGNSNLPAN